jgi:ABC-2 type transport system ATP-binding protein
VGSFLRLPVCDSSRRYVDHPAPLGEVGALLEARAVHPGRSARNHLLSLAATHAIGASRVDQVLDLAGLSDVAGRRVGSFSLGMRQRLGIASALLGDPGTVILDEPINGLDPEGVRWVRNLLKALAAEGRTVFLSSHVMSELALTAQRVIVVGQGRLTADADVAELLARSSSLEEAFLDMTAGAVEYGAPAPERSPRWSSRSPRAR